MNIKYIKPELEPKYNQTQGVLILNRTELGNRTVVSTSETLSYRHKFVLNLVNGKNDAIQELKKLYSHWDIKQIIRDLKNLELITISRQPKDLIVNKSISKKNAIINKTGEVDTNHIKVNLIAIVMEVIKKDNSKYVDLIINSEDEKTTLLKLTKKICLIIKLTRSEELSKLLNIEFNKYTLGI